jgi:hypothetical protein
MERRIELMDTGNVAAFFCSSLIYLPDYLPDFRLFTKICES